MGFNDDFLQVRLQLWFGASRSRFKMEQGAESEVREGEPRYKDLRPLPCSVDEKTKKILLMSSTKTQISRWPPSLSFSLSVLSPYLRNRVVRESSMS